MSYWIHQIWDKFSTSILCTRCPMSRHRTASAWHHTLFGFLDPKCTVSILVFLTQSVPCRAAWHHAFPTMWPVLSPLVPMARWALIHHFLSVWMSVTPSKFILDQNSCINWGGYLRPLTSSCGVSEWRWAHLNVKLYIFFYVLYCLVSWHQTAWCRRYSQTSLIRPHWSLANFGLIRK